MPVDYHEPVLMADSHTETDRGEVRVPVSRQFCFLSVEANLGSKKIKGFSVAPEVRFIMESILS